MALDTTPPLLPADGPQPDDTSTGEPGAPPGRRRRRRRLIAAAVVLLVVTGAGLWWFVLRDDSPGATAVTLTPTAVEVTTGTFGETVSAEGTVAAADSEDLSFTSPGTVTSVLVAAGDSVTAGQVLATIDSAELAEAVADAEADLADAEAQLSDDADAGASDEQLAADEAAVTTAEDALADAQEALEGASLVAGIDGLVTSVDLTVGEELGGSGVGGTDLTGSGSGSGQSAGGFGSADSSAAAAGGGAATTTTSTAQISIVSAGSFQVELAVDTADIDAVEVGQEVELTISTDIAGSSTDTTGFPGGFGPPGGGGFPGAQTDSGASTEQDNARDDAGGDSSADSSDDGAGDVTATGTVAEVGRVADASSGVATYQVLVTFAADADQVWVGSAATAEIQVDTRTDVTQVSSRAVSSVDGDSVVTVALDSSADGETEVRAVELGATSGDMVEIVSGLKPGEYVIVELPSFGGGAGGEMPAGVEPPADMELPSGATPPGAVDTEAGS